MFTFSRGCQAHIIGGGIAIIPDQVADDQKEYDGRVVRAIVRGQIRAVRLRGDLYDLCGPGTGDPVVEDLRK